MKIEWQNNEEGLCLITEIDGEALSLHFDFLSDKLNFRLNHSNRRNEAIAKACGLKKNLSPTVVDATAGMGRDAFMLASLGCQVTMLERTDAIYKLLDDALQRLYANSEFRIDNFKLIQANSIDWLNNLSDAERPDVIYLDPMFPERKKSALVKKEMRIFKRLAGEDLDADELLSVALTKAKQRVVVKRPAKAPFLAIKKPSMQIASKKHRFDVYLSS